MLWNIWSPLEEAGQRGGVSLRKACWVEACTPTRFPRMPPMALNSPPLVRHQRGKKSGSPLWHLIWISWSLGGGHGSSDGGQQNKISNMAVNKSDFCPFQPRLAWLLGIECSCLCFSGDCQILPHLALWTTSTNYLTNELTEIHPALTRVTAVDIFQKHSLSAIYQDSAVY